MKIGNNTIGGNSPVFVIAEMAWSHDGSVFNAEAILDAAIQAKADAIGIHITSMKDYMVKDYMVNGKNLYDFLSAKNLSDDDWISIIETAHENKVAVCAMCNDIPSVRKAFAWGVDAFVVSPASLGEHSLIDIVMSYKLPVIFRIGGATLVEIGDLAVYINKFKNGDVAFLHGYQNYPTELSDSDLESINFLKSQFGVPVGFADHVDAESKYAAIVPLLAVAKGADIIEKHVTHDRSKKGIDYESAMNPDEFVSFVKDLHEVEKSLRFSSSDAARKYRKLVRKRVVAARDMPAGSEIDASSFVFKRANDGIDCGRFREFVGKYIKVPMKADEPLLEEKVGI